MQIGITETSAAATRSAEAGQNGQAQPGKPTVVVLAARGGFGEVGEREILERAGCEVVVTSASNEDEAIEAARDADGLIMPPALSRRFLESLKRCRVIACSSIGMDRVESVEVANEKGIIICNVPDVFVDEVANHTMALLLAATRWIVQHATYVAAGGWGQRGRSRPGGRIHRITGETLGLVGFGNIGRAVAKRAAGFDLKVIAYDPYVSKDVFDLYGAQQASLGRVLQDSDFVSVHVPLLPQTRHLIGAAQFGLMKPHTIVVNTSRGPVIDEQALIAALQSGQIMAAALDVTEKEPVDPDNPLLKMPNVIVTPHMASASDWAGAERRRRPAQEVAAVLTGHRPRAVWNPQVLEQVSLK